MTDDDDIQAIQAVHEHLQAGERVLLFGRCRVKGELAKNLLWFYSVVLVALLMIMFYPICVPLGAGSVNIVPLVGSAILIAPLIMALSFWGRPFDFCALTDRRLIQWGTEGVVELAEKSDVREITGTDGRVLLLVAQDKRKATEKEHRLGKSKTFQRIELYPVRRFAEIVGGKELLIDTIGNS